MHPKLRLTIVVVMAAALGLTGGIGTAGAHKRKLPRHTTVVFEDLPGSSGDRISGQVSIGAPQEPPLEGGLYLARSAGLAANCLKGQRVEIKHALTAEGGGGGAATLVATAVTNATGAWETRQQGRPSTGALTAPGVRATPRRGEVPRRCRYAMSATISA